MNEQNETEDEDLEIQLTVTAVVFASQCFIREQDANHNPELFHTVHLCFPPSVKKLPREYPAPALICFLSFAMHDCHACFITISPDYGGNVSSCVDSFH